MDSPGGSTSRSGGTPIRLTPTSLSRGQHHVRSVHSSSLLDDVLAEKKMALMQSPEVIQFLQSIQASVQEKNKPLSRSASPEQTSALSSSTVSLATSVSQTIKAVTLPAKGYHTPQNLHESSELTGRSVLLSVQQHSHGQRNVDQQTGTGDENCSSSTHQNLEPQEILLRSSSSSAPLASDVQFVSVSAVIPGTVQYVLQPDLHQVNAASVPSSAASSGRITGRVHTLPTSKTKHTLNRHLVNTSSTGGQTKLVVASHSQIISNLSQILPRSSNNLVTSAPVQIPNSPMFSNAPVQIDSSRHHLITEWLNANINVTEMDSDDVKDLTEH